MTAVKLLASLFFALWLSLPSLAQAYPQTQFDDTIPTLEQVTGHDFGEEITTSADINRYFQALAASDPSRMQIRSYGKTWQGRDLFYAVISSPDNMARLDSIQATLARIGDGVAVSATEMAATPAVSWLSYGVHGDEITPSGSAMYMAYYLMAAQNDALANTILQNSIVIIDPNQNPDGRERFINGFVSARGLEPQGDRYAAEHDQVWPRGRFNHYIFDLNRDWFALTQPETRGKVAALLDWHPVVFVDSHEMGGDNTYFFPPSAEPFNPNIVDAQRKKQSLLGQTMARYFDQFGVPYFTREIFDAFYPGYGDMWPTLNGTVAMTFEQGSPRGLIYDRRDGTQLTYAEGVRNNVLASLGTLQTVAQNKSAFLNDFAQYRRTAISQAERSDDRYVVFDLASRRFEAESLARRLAAQGIEVQRAGVGTRQCGRDAPAGALIIDSAQGQGRLIRTLLNPSTALDDGFIAEQESRRDRGLNHELYDVTAWSMPLMDGVKARYCKRVDLSNAVAVAAHDPIPSQATDNAGFGVAVPWHDGGQARLVIAALRAGLKGKTTDAAFTQNGREFPPGSVIFPHADNPDDYLTRLKTLARNIGAEYVGMETSWVDTGPNWGSSAFAALTMPRVAMAWGDGTVATSAGNTRFVLERYLGIPVTPIRTSTLRRADLSRYDVVILPDTSGDLEHHMRSGRALKAFVAGGGVLIALAGSIDMLADEELGLLATELELAAHDAEADGGASKTDEDGPTPGVLFETEADYEAYIADTEARPEDIPGVLVRAVANSDHWLAAGYDAANVLVTGRQIYRPLNVADGMNVFRFDSADKMLLSGYLWEENRAQLAFKPFVMAQSHGDGVVIGFTQSPTTRAYLNGLNLLIANAAVLGPARVSQ